MTAQRSITVTAMSRPHLFRAMLESLVANDLEGWRVVIRVEPGERAHEFEPIAAEVLGGAGVEYDLKINDTVLGITSNPLRTLEAAFAAGSQLNLYLEEDLLVSPDVTRLADWYEREHQQHWMALSLLAGPCGSTGLLSNAAYPELLFEARTFNSLGWVMRRQEWERYASQVWPANFRPLSNENQGNWRVNWGWDWCLYGLVANTDLRTVQPALARATHNGREGGTYASPEFHDQGFSKLSINRQRQVDYRLTAFDDLPQDVRAHARMHDEVTDMRLLMEQVAISLSPFRGRIRRLFGV